MKNLLEEELKRIPGNEHAKRALEIALKGNHSIKFIGNWEAEALAGVGKEQGLKAYAFAACPCGNLNTENECICHPRTLKAHKRGVRSFAADLVVRTVKPKWSEVKVLLPKMDKNTADLLEAIYDKMGLKSIEELETLLRVARTIQRLAETADLEANHLAEAAQYLQTKIEDEQ